MLPCTAATRAIWFCTSGAAKERMVLVLKPSLHDAVWCKNGALDLITLFRIDTQLLQYCIQAVRMFQ